jgi:hypothetical protein
LRVNALAVQLFFAPPSRGWLLVRPSTHAVLFLTRDESWTDTSVGAHFFEQQNVVERVARRHEGSFAMPAKMLDWVKPPIVTVSHRLVTA